MPIDPYVAQHDPQAGKSAKSANQEAVLDTFPASDPAQKAETGARAVPAADMMMRPEDEVIPENPMTLAFSYTDREKAKLALEGVVRDIPLERHLTSIEEQGEGAILRVTAGKVDVQRVADMLARSGGEQR
ncbi:hypothetical protein [Roseomonas sp. BN140053]|uniref:hypothetical protein n=1 Tax=Roseomonas sp. BN140053 TaxID=3391898 RepID=UPI0039E89F9E